MTTTLQQAMIKAGLVSKKKVEELTNQESPKRGRPSGDKKPGFIEGKHHHHLRTECEACKKSSPDVEYYEHRNQSLVAKWLCLTCADYYKIHDDCRQTVQSSHSQSKLFRRSYGPTKVFK
ncbi:MAG: hypothetical protein HYT76_07560 [Deltaproteobacteria bacterium]|nr:hypothetical protein [Deltaproteobacteria bacterium]